MIQQFQKLLQTPRPSFETYMKMMQDVILNTMEELMPQNFDFAELTKMFENSCQNDNIASLTYKLTQFFGKAISQNFISLYSYFSLEEQTQKLESTIRGHIKMEQQMKMYLEHLQYKIQRYEYHFRKLRKNTQLSTEEILQLKQFKEKDTFEDLKKRQTQLLKQRLILLKKVDHMQRKLRDNQTELKRMNSPTSATIQQIKEGIHRDREALLIKPTPPTIIPETKGANQAERRMSTNSFGSDHQITQKKTSIPLNTVQGYRIHSSPRDEMTQLHNNIQPSEALEINQVEQIYQIFSERGTIKGDYTYN